MITWYYYSIHRKLSQSLAIAPILKYNDTITLAEAKEAYVKGTPII